MVNTRDMAKAMREKLTFSKEEIEELMKAKAMPITFDRDCPETSLHQMVQSFVQR